jgi:hypothetical protein
MRPPRYHFPDEVRSATREMAAQSVRAGTVARTPEELDAWILQQPGYREPLERGGYTTEFTASDLFPLYEVMVEQAGGPARPTAAAAPAYTWRSVGMFAAVALTIAAFAGIIALTLALS